MCSAYGREASMRCCVRRSFEAATISMAFVIFCVFFTLLILVRISLPLAIRFHLGGEKWCRKLVSDTFFRFPPIWICYLPRSKKGVWHQFSIPFFRLVRAGRREAFDRLLQLGLDLVVVVAARVDVVEQRTVVRASIRVQAGLERHDLVDRDVVEVAVVHGEQR